jgi:AraC-like DNA-binding protein
MEAVQPDPRIEKAVRLLNEDSSRTLADLARDCTLSISRLSHLFKAKTGHTVGDFRRKCQFQAATKMLATTDMSIKQIAYALGYHHTSSFVRAFELHLGVSPCDYRDYGIRGHSAAVAADKDQATLSTTTAGFARTPA